MSSTEYEEIIRVIETKNCIYLEKNCGRCKDEQVKKKICLIRIYREASDEPRPVIELDREDQQFFTYEVIKCFNSIKEAHDYAEEHDIIDIEY